MEEDGLKMAEGRWFMRKVEWGTQSYLKPRRGYFHEWVVLGDRIYAIVELENGTMTTVRMRDIKFVAEEGKENEE